MQKGNYRSITPRPAGQSLGWFNSVLAVITVLLIGCVGVAIPLVLDAKKAKKELNKPQPVNPIDSLIKQIVSSTTSGVLPTRYSVPVEYLMPPSDQKSRGVCWGFAALDLMESQYRVYGIKNKFLAPEQYVRFSKQAYLKWLLDQCRAHPEVAPCQHGGFADNTTEDHKLDGIYYFLKDFPNLSTSILPDSVCPYQGEEANQDKCDGMEQALAHNPITFTIKSIKSASDIEGAKRLLVEAGRPIGIGLPIDRYKFWAPCDSSNYSNQTQCLNRTTRCPAGYSSTYCHLVEIDARIRDGTFGFVDDVSRARSSGGHAMNIVGYNDDWVYRTRKSSEKSLANLRGGFIMHNSWGDPGHSVDFLVGRLSDENEAVQCPNHLNPANWIPTTSDCVRRQNGNASACVISTALERVRGQGRTKHPDVLKCTNPSYCNLSRSYALAELDGDIDVQSLFSGLDRIHVISWTSGQDVRDEYIDMLPFWALRSGFEPQQIVPNRPGLCGYWMYPYGAIEIVNRVQWSLLDTFHVADIEFEFTKASYAGSSERNPAKNYSLLEKSVGKFDRLSFDGPLPYNYVYK